MITPRTTRLVRASEVQAFRAAVADLATAGPVLAARDRLVVVPTRAAAEQLTRTIETAPGTTAAVVLPDMTTPAELVGQLAARLSLDRPVLTAAEREVLCGVACRAAEAAGAAPPFAVRAGLIAEILRFYDALRDLQKDVDAFERLTLGLLEPGADDDRGAARLVRQTRFLATAFREYETRHAAAGLDRHDLRAALAVTAAGRPYRHLVVAVGDHAFDPHGLVPADWDLLARLPGLLQLDVVVTDRVLAGAFHERIHHLLPGLEETRVEVPGGGAAPTLHVTESGGRVHVDRDREEEVAAFARRVKAAVRDGRLTALERAALVVHQPLPYVYVAQERLRAAGIPYQMSDALPLAGEPYAALLDQIVATVASGFARGPAVALLRSPHLRVVVDGAPVSPAEADGLDRALGLAGYLGDPASLDRLRAEWAGPAARPPRGVSLRDVRRGGEALAAVVAALDPLRQPAPVADHLACLLAFLAAYEHTDGDGGPVHARHLRARAAILTTLRALQAAFDRFDRAPVPLDAVAMLVRRWIESQTFAPRVGDGGVHVVDAASAVFGDFDDVQLAGLVEGEWPEAPRRSIFYASGVLRELGWPPEAHRAEGVRSAFADLLRLSSGRVLVSSFALEADALVSASPFLDEVDAAGLDEVREPASPARVFVEEALDLDPVRLEWLEPSARRWAELRRARPAGHPSRFQGATDGHAPAIASVSTLERYQECPFRFFAADVLGLGEPVEEDAAASPRVRGQFVHEFLHRFVAAWDRAGGGPITAQNADAARALATAEAEPLLQALPDADAAFARTRLFGSAISVGVVDAFLAFEAARPPEAVVERWLEHAFQAPIEAGEGQPSIVVAGKADRVDLLPGRRLRVVDYKTGRAPDARRVFQTAVYAVAARDELARRDGAPWAIEEAAYVSFGGKRPELTGVKASAAEAKKAEALDEAVARMTAAVAGIRRGEFPPRPHEPFRCRFCPYPSVCRKDYVDDD